MSFRDLLPSPSFVPPWLATGNAAKYLYTMGLALDALGEKWQEGQLAKFPNRGDDSFIPYLAADRVMVQGPNEPNASFTTRLGNHLAAWSVAGSRISILSQLQAYMTGLNPGVAVGLPEMTIVGGNISGTPSRTTWDVLQHGAPQGSLPVHTMVSPQNWNWDGKNYPSRAWLILQMHLVYTGNGGAAATVASTGGSGLAGVTSGFATVTGLAALNGNDVGRYLTTTGAATSANNGTFQIVAVLSASSCIIANTAAVAPDANSGAIVWTTNSYPFIAPAPVWGSPARTWGAASTWGLTCSPQTLVSIRNILRTWKGAGTHYPNILVSFGSGNGQAGTEFSPLSTAGAGNPDGTWGTCTKLSAGVRVPAFRPLNPFTVACDGTGLYVSCTEINRS